MEDNHNAGSAWTCPNCGVTGDPDTVTHTQGCYMGALIAFMRMPETINYIRSIVEAELTCSQQVFGPRERLHVHDEATANFFANTSGGDITIGPYTFFGHGVMLLTGKHDATQFGKAFRDTIVCSGQDIVIGEGVWVASGAMVLGPCRIGDHAIVKARSVVTHDVPAYAIVQGQPARVVKYRQPSAGHDGAQLIPACSQIQVAKPQEKP